MEAAYKEQGQVVADAVPAYPKSTRGWASASKNEQVSRLCLLMSPAFWDGEHESSLPVHTVVNHSESCIA